MKYSLIVLLLLGLLNFSCSNSTSSDETEKISLPLKVGNSWTYDVTNTSYSVDPPEVTMEVEAIFRVQSDTIINENRWFFITSDKNNLNELMAGYYSNQEDGIHYKRSLESTSVEKKSTNLLPLYNNDFFSKTNQNETGEYPFLHHPDTEISDRLIKNETIIASVTYKGESEDENFKVTTQNYIWNYYQQTVGSRTYTFVPFDQYYSVSNEVGFIIFERAYSSMRGTTEEDPRLRLLSIVTFELSEFNEVK